MILVNQVCAGGVGPAQVAPKVTIGIVLEKEMPLGTNLDQAIRLIHPVFV
jgi:glycerol uptake facilitator-like aquaporin